jgi:hypothetical protein
VFTGDVNAPLTQLALQHFTLHFEAGVGVTVHSKPPRRERIDASTTIIVPEPASDALGLHIETAFGPPALRVVDHLAAWPTAKKAIAEIEFADPTPT